MQRLPSRPHYGAQADDPEAQADAVLVTRLAKIASSKNEASLSYALSDNGYPARSLSQEGAIDMAKVALQHAKDEQVRKWAQDVLREQEREITDMRA